MFSKVESERHKSHAELKLEGNNFIQTFKITPYLEEIM